MIPLFILGGVVLGGLVAAASSSDSSSSSSSSSSSYDYEAERRREREAKRDREQYRLKDGLATELLGVQRHLQNMVHTPDHYTVLLSELRTFCESSNTAACTEWNTRLARLDFGSRKKELMFFLQNVSDIKSPKAFTFKEPFTKDLENIAQLEKEITLLSDMRKQLQQDAST